MTHTQFGHSVLSREASIVSAPASDADGIDERIPERLGRSGIEEPNVHLAVAACSMSAPMASGLETYTAWPPANS